MSARKVRKVPKHGTYARAQREYRTGEPMCDLCRAAYNAYMRERRERDPKARAQHRVEIAAGDKARRTLAELHPEQYRALYHAYKGQILAEQERAS